MELRPPPPITLEEFGHRLKRAIGILNRDRNFGELSFAARYQINGLEVLFDEAMRATSREVAKLGKP
jgi:hypothetical protein